MAKTVWKRAEDIKAFGEGLEAASHGKTRQATVEYLTYNERAAFNDGWDSFTGYRPLPAPFGHRALR